MGEDNFLQASMAPECSEALEQIEALAIVKMPLLVLANDLNC